MADSYATVQEYRDDTGDTNSPDEQVKSTLAKQSAKLRGLTGIKNGQTLTEDQALLARDLVTDAARKQLVPPSFDGMGDISGASQASFSANGFQQSFTLTNPSGTAYFDKATLNALKKSLGTSQKVGTICPYYGG